MTRYSRVIGTGGYLPAEVRTNEHISQTVDTSDSWIYERTGIKSRRIAAADETASSMAEIAARQAIEAAGCEPQDIDLIIVATSTPDRVYPSTGCLLQERLGIRNCVAFDVQAACSGSIFALSIADQYIKTGAAKKKFSSSVLKLIHDWWIGQIVVPAYCLVMVLALYCWQHQKKLVFYLRIFILTVSTRICCIVQIPRLEVKPIEMKLLL